SSVAVVPPGTVIDCEVSSTKLVELVVTGSFELAILNATAAPGEAVPASPGGPDGPVGPVGPVGPGGPAGSRPPPKSTGLSEPSATFFEVTAPSFSCRLPTLFRGMTIAA